MKDVSVLIPARSEMFLARTVEDLLEHSESDFEIIVVLDGQWANPPIAQHPKVNVIYVPKSVGQRAATNLAAKLSQAKYIVKCDAHCSFDQGWDKKMIQAFEDNGDNNIIVPIMKNLHVFDWKCYYCGWKKYQGPTPEKCGSCGKKGKMRRKMVWQPRRGINSTSYSFDSEPHFQYNSEFKHSKEGQIGTIVGYKVLIDFSLLTSDSLADVVSQPLVGTKPSTRSGIVNLLADFTRSHQFTILPNSFRFWENMPSDTVSFSPIDNGWGVGVQEINFIRDKSEMERIATLPVLTDVVQYGYILTSSSGDGTYKPRISESVCEGFLSELCAASISPTINSSLKRPTTRRTIHSDTLDKFNSILGGEFVYSEKRKCFHNGSVALIPIHDKRITETMSLQGSFFMATREKYWELKLSDEEVGNWGNQGIELAGKMWLSGGRVLCNHNTWYAHMFRTQGGDFGFPYPLPGRDVSRAKKAVWEYFFSDKFKQRKHPVSWLIERFSPVPGWSPEAIQVLKDREKELKMV